MLVARILIDGLAMSAVFNLAAGLLMAIDPMIFGAAYPKQLQKLCPKTQHVVRDKLLFGGLVILPVVLFGVVSAYLAGIHGFWTLFWVGYVQWFLVNLGDFFGLDLLLREKLGERAELPGTHGHPCYIRKNWMKALGIPEHWVLWPLIICPLFGFISAGLGMLLR